MGSLKGEDFRYPDHVGKDTRNMCRGRQRIDVTMPGAFHKNVYIYAMWRDVLFPNRCVGCSIITARGNSICESCRNGLAFTHHQFGQSNEFWQKCSLLFEVKDAAALLQYRKAELTQRLLHALKYKGLENVGKELAELALDRLNWDDIQPDVLVTIPLHPKKQQLRGYNQLHLFADTLGKNLGVEVCHDALRKPNPSREQALKNKLRREKDTARFLPGKAINQRNILLIDDVFTTGNTMASAVYALANEPDAQISVLVMAMDE